MNVKFVFSVVVFHCQQIRLFISYSGTVAYTIYVSCTT